MECFVTISWKLSSDYLWGYCHTPLFVIAKESTQSILTQM